MLVQRATYNNIVPIRISIEGQVNLRDIMYAAGLLDNQFKLATSKLLQTISFAFELDHFLRLVSAKNNRKSELTSLNRFSND